MKKLLLGSFLGLAICLASTGIASADPAMDPVGPGDPDSPIIIIPPFPGLGFKAQKVTATLMPHQIVTIDPSSIVNAKINYNGNLSNDLVAAFNIQSNSGGALVKLGAERVENTDVMNKVCNDVRIALVRDGATPAAINNALKESPQSSPNVIAYNVVTEPTGFNWLNAEKKLSKTMNGMQNSVKFKIMPTAVANTFDCPEDQWGSYSATITCTALEP